MLRRFPEIVRSPFVASEDGANAVEFALVLMPMVIVSFLVLDVAAVFFAYNDIHNAAREGARKMAVEDGILFGDKSGTSFDVDGPTFTCSGAGLKPDAGTVEKSVCDFLVGWSARIEVSTFAERPKGNAGLGTDCSEVTVKTRMDMGDAALFDFLGLLSGRTMIASATYLSEYDLVDADNRCGS